MNTDELLTIREASQMSEKSEGLIYRYIRQGKINVQSCSVHSSGKFRQVKKVKTSEVLTAFGLNFEPETEQDRTQLNQRLNKAEQEKPLTRETIKEVIEGYFQDRETRLMKPLEEQSLFLAGKLQAENQFLKDRLETVLQELEEVRAGIKALPGPPVEVAARLEELEKETELFRKKAEELEKGKVELQQKQTQKEEEIEKLKATVKSQAEETRDQAGELEKAKKEEEDLKATIEELKRRLEAEEKKPWYRKLF